LDHASTRREAGITCCGIKPVRRADLLRMICEAMQAPSASAEGAAGTEALRGEPVADQTLSGTTYGLR
jgi:hypothetical protein